MRPTNIETSKRKKKETSRDERLVKGKEKKIFFFL